MKKNLSQNKHTIFYENPVAVLGAVEPTSAHLRNLLISDVPLICADGGGNIALEFGLKPDYIIGDMDSFSKPFDGEVVHLSEQETTDFEKCLYTVEAPFYICYGFLGGRLDHELAVLSVLVRYPEKRIVVAGERDICFCCPDYIELDLPIDTRVSIFPMSEVKMRSSGLQWPLDGLDLFPVSRIATSNRVSEPRVTLSVERGKTIVILPAEYLGQVQSVLAGG